MWWWWGRLLLAIALVYVVWSCLEYVAHRYLMHSSRSLPFATRHLLHHVATRSNMTLNKQHPGYATLGEEENLCFSGWESLAMYAIGLVMVIPCVAAVGAPLRSSITLWTALFAVCLAFYTNITWNTIHPLVHGESPTKCGPLVIRSPRVIHGSWFTWLQQNHRAHHAIKGPRKGNFNVTLPGADFLFGTYRTLPAGERDCCGR